MKSLYSKTDIIIQANDFFETNWLGLGQLVAGSNPKKKYKMTDSQIRFIVLTLLDRNLLHKTQ